MTFVDAIVTVFYGIIGISGAAAVLVFFWGFTTYIARLGTERRKDGIKIMGQAIGLIMTSVIMIGLLHLTDRWFGIL